MLTASFNGPLKPTTLTACHYRPEENHLGDLGWPKFVRDAAGTVADGVGDLANWTGRSVESVARGAGNLWCDVTTNSSAQTAAALAALYPDPYSKGAAAGMAVNTAMCSAARGPGQPTTQPTIGPVLPVSKPKTIAQRLPPGSLQAQIPGTAKWMYAIPKGSVLTPLSGNGLGSVSPWLGRGFVSPSARSLNQRIQRQYSWYDVNTADQPYLVAWGLAQPFAIVGTGERSDKAAVVDPKTLKSQTTPVYKKWWFWAAIASSAAAVGAGGYLAFRRK